MEGRQCIAAGRSPYEEGSPLAHSQLTALGDRLSPGTTESLQRRPQHNEAIIRQRAMQKRARAEAKLTLYLKTQPGTAKAAAAKAKLAAFISRQEEKLRIAARRGWLSLSPSAATPQFQSPDSASSLAPTNRRRLQMQSPTRRSVQVSPRNNQPARPPSWQENRAGTFFTTSRQPSQQRLAQALKPVSDAIFASKVNAFMRWKTLCFPGQDLCANKGFSSENFCPLC